MYVGSVTIEYQLDDETGEPHVDITAKGSGVEDNLVVMLGLLEFAKDSILNYPDDDEEPY